MKNILVRVRKSLLGWISSSSKARHDSAEKGHPGERHEISREMARLLITSDDQVDPLLAKRLTQLEASMARLAKAHSDTLRERESLSREVSALRTAFPRPRERPESPLDFTSPDSVI